MNIIDRLSYWLRKSRGNVFPDTELIVEFAFTSGGVDYYQVNNLFNLPINRGLEAVHIYDELQMKCDRDYLDEHAKFVDEQLSGSIGLEQINNIKLANDQMKQRLDWVFTPDIAFKLASVVFFDANERPEHYDAEYCRRKIERWKKNDDVADFFLRTPCVELMPFLKGFDENFPNYIQIIQKVDKHHKRNFYTSFSETDANKPSDK